jgi:hypothetical protein
MSQPVAIRVTSWAIIITSLKHVNLSVSGFIPCKDKQIITSQIEEWQRVYL